MIMMRELGLVETSLLSAGKAGWMVSHFFKSEVEECELFIDSLPPTD